MADQKVFSPSKKVEKLNDTIKHDIDAVSKIMRETENIQKKRENKEAISSINKHYMNIIQCAVLAIQEMKNK